MGKIMTYKDIPVGSLFTTDGLTDVAYKDRPDHHIYLSMENWAEDISGCEREPRHTVISIDEAIEYYKDTDYSFVIPPGYGCAVVRTRWR